MRSSLLILLFVFIGGTEPSWAAEKEWWELVYQFTAESTEARKKAIEKLRSDPLLNERLRGALDGDRRFLAYDAIGTLKLYSFIPELQKRAERDPSGVPLITLNSLMTRSNQSKMERFYRRMLMKPGVSQPTKVIILDTLARLRSPISDRLLRRLAKNQNAPEVQGAVLHYLRLMWKNNRELGPKEKSEIRGGGLKKEGGQTTGYPFPAEPLSVFLRASSFQIRLQALFLLEEGLKAGVFEASDSNEIRNALTTCSQDSQVEVQSMCRKLGRQLEAV